MNNAMRQVAFAFMFAAVAVINQPPVSAQNSYDSFNSNSADQGSMSGSAGMGSDTFSDDSASSSQLTTVEINQQITTFSRSLPNDPKALAGIIDQLLRKRLDNWHYPNLSKLTVWTGDCSAVFLKATVVNNNTTQNQDTFQTGTTGNASQTEEQKREASDCWNAWYKAYSTVLGLLPHSSTEELEPYAAPRKAAALQAIELAEAICNSHQQTAVPPPPPGGAGHHGTSAKGNVPASVAIVLRGATTTDAHFNKVKTTIGNLPANVQQFMRNHHVKVVATDTVVAQRPDLHGVHPRGYAAGWTWDNSEGTFDKPHNQVIVGARLVNGGVLQNSPRVEAVARHESGHAVDHSMGDFSHNNHTFVDTYNGEANAPMTPADEEAMHYILQDGEAGPEEAFAEAFATIYGGAAAGAPIQHLMEHYFPHTIATVKHAMDTLH
jgi:hypothetical protein